MNPLNRIKRNFSLNTLDVTTGVVTGVITSVYSNLIPLALLEVYLLSLGVGGWAAFYLYEGVYFVMHMTGGWLRKKAGVVVLSGLVTGFIGFFLGSPEGAVLILLLLTGGLVGGMFLDLMNWKKTFLVAFAAGGLYFLSEETVFFTGTGFWPYPFEILLGTYILGFISNGIITGYLSQVISKAVTKAGIAEIPLEQETERKTENKK